MILQVSLSSSFPRTKQKGRESARWYSAMQGSFLLLSTHVEVPLGLSLLCTFGSVLGQALWPQWSLLGQFADVDVGIFGSSGLG